MTREEAREILTHNWTRVDNPDYSESELDEAFFMAIEALADRPTGKWIVKYGSHCGVLIKEYYCDQCGKSGGLATMLYDDKPLPNFCGHCGADMRVKKR